MRRRDRGATTLCDPTPGTLELEDRDGEPP